MAMERPGVEATGNEWRWRSPAGKAWKCSGSEGHRIDGNGKGKATKRLEWKCYGFDRRGVARNCKGIEQRLHALICYGEAERRRERPCKGCARTGTAAQ